MKLSYTIICVFCSLLLVVSACSTRPRDVLSEKKMVGVLQDMYIANAIFTHHKTDIKTIEEKDALINSVLAKHNITQADLDSSLVWYADNIEIYSQIQDSVNSKLQKRNDMLSAITEEQYSYQLVGYGVTVPEHFVLDVNNPTFRLRIDSAKLSIFELAKFQFSFETQGVDTSFHNLEASMYFRYKDTTIVEKMKLRADDYYQFDKPKSHPDSLLKDISGYIHLAMATNKMPKIYLNNINNKSGEIVAEADSVAAKVDPIILKHEGSAKQESLLKMEEIQERVIR